MFLRQLLCLLLGFGMLHAFADRALAQDPFGPRLTATRVNLAHGRVDDIREAGILTTANPKGAPVRGAVPIMDAIAALPNPRLITLGLNKDGNAPADMKSPSPILTADALAPLSSGMSLVVAEVPAGGTFDGWQSLHTRFSDGNFYASVSIPDKKIVAGMELVTFQHFKDYAANSIFFEAPDFGTLVVKNNLTGGSTTVAAGVSGKKITANYGFANPLQLTLSGSGSRAKKDKTAEILLTAKLPTAFESPALLRYAATSSKETIIRDVLLPAAASDRTSSFRSVTIRIQIKADVDETVGISAVASAGPFLLPLPKAPQTVGLQTFQSKGSTLEDTLLLKITKKKPRPEDEYVVWKNNVGWIHVGTVKDFETPRTKGSEIWGGLSSEIMKYTPMLGGMHFESEEDAMKALAADIGASLTFRRNPLAEPRFHYTAGDLRVGFEIVNHTVFDPYRAAAGKK